MPSIEDRKKRIDQLTAMIEELQSDDEKFADFDEPTYENAVRSLRDVITYHEHEIEKSNS